MALDYKSIGDRVRRYRHKQHLTQAALAERAELEPSYISHIERGQTKPSLPTIVCLANALSVSVDALLCDNLVESRPVFEKEMAELLASCSDSEVKTLAATLDVFINRWRELR